MQVTDLTVKLAFIFECKAHISKFKQQAMTRTMFLPYFFSFFDNVTLRCTSQYGRTDLLLLQFHHEFKKI